MESLYLKALRARLAEAASIEAEKENYFGWSDVEFKDTQITFRISKGDVMKLKTLARMRNMKYQTLLRDVLRSFVHREEEKLATRGASRAKREMMRSGRRRTTQS